MAQKSFIRAVAHSDIVWHAELTFAASSCTKPSESKRIRCNIPPSHNNGILAHLHPWHWTQSGRSQRSCCSADYSTTLRHSWRACRILHRPSLRLPRLVSGRRTPRLCRRRPTKVATDPVRLEHHERCRYRVRHRHLCGRKHERKGVMAWIWWGGATLLSGIVGDQWPLAMERRTGGRAWDTHRTRYAVFGDTGHLQRRPLVRERPHYEWQTHRRSALQRTSPCSLNPNSFMNRTQQIDHLLIV